jgi:hypothetical protein
VSDLPELEPTDRFPALAPLMRVRGIDVGAPLHELPPGAELDALARAAPELKGEIVAAGRPNGVTTCDLITLPSPTGAVLSGAVRVPSPLAWRTVRMLVVQWEEDGRTRTLLWGPTDHERLAATPALARQLRRGPLADALLAPNHGTVLGHLRALGIDPADVDYLAFDHLHGQDLRRLLGTTRPAPDLGSADDAVAAWFPRAVLLTQRREWATLRHVHPLQAPRYQAATFADLPPQRVALVDGDVLVGPGVALVATPGHTLGTMSLVVHTDDGVWVVSANGVAAECWSPRASRLPGVRRWAGDRGLDVLPNASTADAAVWQYGSMVVERMLADAAADAPVPRCFPTEELTAHPLSPRLRPTHVHERIEHGAVRGSSLLPTGEIA